MPGRLAQRLRCEPMQGASDRQQPPPLLSSVRAFLIRSGGLAASRGRISEAQPAKLLAAEPPDGVVLLWLHVRDISAPVARHPDSEVQASIGNETVQHRAAVNAVELDPQFLHYLPPERFLRPLLRFDMPAWEVLHVWVPPPRRRPVTQQQPICLTQNHGHDVMVCHAATMTVGPDTYRLASDGCSAQCGPSLSPGFSGWSGRSESTRAGRTVSRWSSGILGCAGLGKRDGNIAGMRVGGGEQGFDTGGVDLSRRPDLLVARD